MNIEQAEQKKADGILFTDFVLAELFVNRAFEITGKNLRIVLFDCPYYLVCPSPLAERLVEQGYEFAN